MAGYEHSPRPLNFLYHFDYPPLDDYDTSKYDYFELAFSNGLDLKGSMHKTAEQMRNDYIIDSCYNLWCGFNYSTESAKPFDHPRWYSKFQRLVQNSEFNSLSMKREAQLARFYIDHPEIFFPDSFSFIGLRDLFMSDDFEEVLQQRLFLAKGKHPMICIAEESDRYHQFSYPIVSQVEKIPQKKYINLPNADICTNFYYIDTAALDYLSRTGTFTIRCRNFIVPSGLSLPMEVECDNLVVLDIGVSLPSDFIQTYVKPRPSLQPRIHIRYKENYYNFVERDDVENTVIEAYP